MSIVISGLNMPTERESLNLTIKYNGTVLDTETGMQVAEAHELPPHGRLIDADEVLKWARERDDGGPVNWVDSLDLTIWARQHTIIPAEEGET